LNQRHNKCFNSNNNTDRSHSYYDDSRIFIEDGVGALEDEMGYWGQPVDPARRRERMADFEKKLTITSAMTGDMADFVQDEAEAILQRIHDVVEAHLPNSSLSRIAQGWALRMSNMLSRRLATDGWEASSPSRLLDVAAPAPGYHDATAFGS
jgi:hypothetical protein